MKIKFDSERVYGDNDKYVKTKTKLYDINVNTNFQDKRKSVMQLFINNNARFCCESREKVLSSNTFRKMQIWNKKD